MNEALHLNDYSGSEITFEKLMQTFYLLDIRITNAILHSF